MPNEPVPEHFLQKLDVDLLPEKNRLLQILDPTLERFVLLDMRGQLPIPDGSWVTGEYVQDWFNIVSGQAYIVFTMDDGIMFKIIESRIRKEGKLTLHSLNPVYQPYTVKVSEVKEIWKFVNFISKVIPDPVLPERELINTVAGMKHDLDMLKSRMGEEGLEGRE